MSSDERADKLMVLFMLGWALLIVAAFVKAVYSGIRKMCYGDEGRRVSDEDEDASAEIYRSMSPGRQEEIDNLRKNALRRYLSRFTLTLDDEHLLCCAGGSQTDTDTLPPSKNEVNDESIALDASSKGNVERHGDIEEGNKDFVEDRDDMAQDCNSTAVEYTHISLPLPGCDANGINILCSMVADNNRVRQADGEATGPTTTVSKKWMLTCLLFRNEDSCPCEDGAIEEKTEPVAKRTVPIFCAICLSEYVKCDRVCWSSNAECSHVFHEECILQWLISLGKKKSMNQLFTQHPTDEKLLRNQFCPCCRQDFISVKPALSGSEESV